MPRIFLFFSNRAEKGLLDPVIKRLSNHSKLTVVDLNNLVNPITAENLGEIYNKCYALLLREKPDLVIAPFDRREIIFVALSAFHLNIPIAQIEAGDLSQGTHDDLSRWAISVYASIHFCNNRVQAKRVKRLLEVINKNPTHIYPVGGTHFDDIILDESLVPSGQYDLVLYNAPTRFPHLIPTELKKIESLLDKHTIWIAPNNDSGSDQIIAKAKELEFIGKVKFYPNLPRPQFLGLLKNATRFISNSSCTRSEALYFKRKVINPSIRNAQREPIEIKKGASDKIVRIITSIFNERGDLS